MSPGAVLKCAFLLVLVLTSGADAQQQSHRHRQTTEHDLIPDKSKTVEEEASVNINRDEFVKTENEIAKYGTAESKKLYSILAVLPYQGFSHQMFFQAVLRVLLKADHQVTTVTTVPMKQNFTNHRQILFKPSITGWGEMFEFEKAMSQSGHEARMDMEILAESFMLPLYGCEGFTQLLRSTQSFDLVILEPFFMQEALVFLGHRFNCPVVALSTAGTETNQDLYMGRTRNPALEPEWLTAANSLTMDFYQRAANTFSFMVNILEHRLYYLPKRESDLYRLVNYPGMEFTPPIRELLQNISLTFVNSHPLLQHPTPVPQNLIMVPGLHIENDYSISKELEALLNTARDGVVLFTMGTMVPVSKMKEERDIFIRTFARLPQLVLWKSDVEIEKLPANIKTFRWLPQRAILGHANCVLFITHGGMLGKQEALYNEVPTISIPLFGDQHSNAGHSQASGLGITLQYRNLTEHALYTAITTVINNNQYRERLSRYSKIFRESVTESEERVLSWVEHIIRHDGAAYLRPSQQLSWFQYYLLDVFALFFLIILISLIILIRCAQAMYRIRFPNVQGPNKIKRQ